jgi:hypothetical protein
MDPRVKFTTKPAKDRIRLPAGDGDGGQRRDSTLMPFSLKYFSAPGCHGMPARFEVCHSGLMLSASLCTRARSARFSSMVLVS